MLYALENAIATTLKSRVREARSTEVSTQTHSVLKPAIHVACQAGEFSKLTQAKWKCDLTANVYLLFQHFENEDRRREGMSLVVMGVVMSLTNKSLGLPIQPLRPKNFRDVTDPEITREGELLYLVQFTTAIEVVIPDDGTENDLLSVGLEYYLQDPADDFKADASDEITFGA